MLEWLSELPRVGREACNELHEFTEASMVELQAPDQSVALGMCTLVQVHERCDSMQDVCVDNGPPALVFSRWRLLLPRHMGVKGPPRAVVLTRSVALFRMPYIATSRVAPSASSFARRLHAT